LGDVDGGEERADVLGESFGRAEGVDAPVKSAAGCSFKRERSVGVPVVHDGPGVLLVLAGGLGCFALLARALVGLRLLRGGRVGRLLLCSAASREGECGNGCEGRESGDGGSHGCDFSCSGWLATSS